MSTNDFEARVARALCTAYIYHSCSATSMHLWSSISATSCQGTFFPQQRSFTLLLIKTTLQQPSCIWQKCNSLPKFFLLSQDLAKITPFTPFFANVSTLYLSKKMSQLSIVSKTATLANPLQLEILALVLSCSYSDPPIEMYICRFAHTCKTKLY
jgi:hypothetical protein